MNRSLDTAKTAFQQALTLLRTGDTAATMLQYLGLDHRDFNPDGGPPIPGSLAPAAASAGVD
jgi:hypothetical protein